MPNNVPGDQSGKDEINQFNLWMRSQPWYQQWFQRQGLDPNKVKLSKGQREDLERTIIANGAPSNAFQDMMIDPAGNLNTEHGFASLPTWAKVAIGAGAAYFAAPYAAALGAGGGAPAAGASGAGMAGTGAYAVPTVASATTAGTAAGTGGSFLSALGGSKGVMSGLSIAGKLASGAAAQRAQDRGAETEFDYLNNQNYNTAMQSRTAQQNSQSLDYAKARTTAEQNRMRQIGSADMLGNSKPPSDPRARLSGAGYMNPETIAMMRDRALKALESGSDVPEPTAIPDYRETSMAQPTKTDSFLKTLGMASTGLGAWDEWRRRQQPEETY